MENLSNEDLILIYKGLRKLPLGKVLHTYNKILKEIEIREKERNGKPEDKK